MRADLGMKPRVHQLEELSTASQPPYGSPQMLLDLEKMLDDKNPSQEED